MWHRIQLSLLLVTLAPSVALAADEEHQGGAMSVDVVVGVFTIIVFVAVLFILKQRAWGPLLTALDERERKIKESLEAAERATAEAARVATEQEQIMAEARRQASEVVAEGKRDAEAVKDKIVADARKGAEDIKDRALADIQRAKDLAVHEIHQRAVELSLAISEKLIHKTLTASDHQALIDETIKSYAEIS